MNKNYHIGVDLGTSAAKSTLFNLDGEAVADASRSMEIRQPQPGYAEQNPEDFVVAACDTIREIVEKSALDLSSVAAVAFDGQMAGATAIDRNWNPITPWYPSALDTPPDKARKAIHIIEKVLEGHEGQKPDFPPRVYYNEFNEDSLNILVLNWYHPADYWSYNALNQRVNLAIMEEFEKEGIQLAPPTFAYMRKVSHQS